MDQKKSLNMIKKILIGLFLLIVGTLNAQIGIDLTEMIPAPDSGYMILTTGDEYPDRGLQKYVRASDILGIDTLFQNGDSLCILMRSEEAYRCFPVHREVRLEKVDGGLRVCWEQRDTVWETRNYLHFPGTSGSYVQARSVNDFEPDTNDFDFEIEFRFLDQNGGIIGNSTGSTSGFSFYSQDGERISVARISNSNLDQVNFSGASVTPQEWTTMKIEFKNSKGRGRMYMNNVLISEQTNESMIGIPVTYAYKTAIGSNRGGGPIYLNGGIRYFRFNDEYFDFSEGSGDTIVSNFGTVMDIRGDVSWAIDTLGYTGIDTSHHCEIIPLTDTHLTNVEHLGDSIRFTLSDSVIFTVRDSFIPQENIIGWIDERIPDTVFFAKTSTATKAIEFGDTLELKGGAININIPVEVDYFPNTNQLEICWTEIELPDQGLQDEGLGSEFNQGGNQPQQLPADTIRLCDTIQLNDVYIDTVFHDGDSLRFVRNDGKTWAVKDSFRTDDDILDLIEMMYDPQWLDIDRDGNEITISISDGNEVSFVDSVRTNQEIAQVARDSIVFPAPKWRVGGKNLLKGTSDEWTGRERDEHYYSVNFPNTHFPEGCREFTVSYLLKRDYDPQINTYTTIDYYGDGIHRNDYRHIYEENYIEVDSGVYLVHYTFEIHPDDNIDSINRFQLRIERTSQ